MPSYGPASKDVQAMIDNLIADFHPDLVETRAQVRAIFAYATFNRFGMEKTPAVSQYGAKCLAKVKVNGEADRVEGKGDATITIDQKAFEVMRPEVREALIDRMLYALRVKRRKGVVRVDERGRPLLGVARPDWVLTGFRAMAERHKADSIEVIQARQYHDEYGQMLLAFGDGPAVEESEADGKPAPKRARRQRGAAAVAAANR